MADYRLYGAETSPYSLKVRAALRYKNVAFDWVSRSQASEADFQASARLPTVPLLIAPGRPASQDSTAILADLEADRPEPTTVPDDPACAALALLVEDYADEWLNKAMFLSRWSQSPDREAAAERVIEQVFAGSPPGGKDAARAAIAERMAGRLDLVGASAVNAPVLMESFQRAATLLNAHLEASLFLFGGRPSAADFALAGQFQQLLSDPTPGEWMRDRAPFVTAWCEFMEAPAPGAPFGPLAELEATLLPFFRDELAVTYLPWAAANAESVARRRRYARVEIGGHAFRQSTQKYAAKSFKSVKKALKGLADAPGLDAFLEAAGAKPYIT